MVIWGMVHYCFTQIIYIYCNYACIHTLRRGNKLMQFIQCAGQENIHTYIPFTAQHEDALFSSIRVLATIEVFPKSADVPFG